MASLGVAGVSLNGSVTMLTLAMPDWRSVSITVAKVPNGTVSSQRKNTGVGLRIVHLRANLAAQVVDVDRVIAEVHQLRAVDGDHQARFGDFLDRLRFRQIHVDAGLQNRRGDHENDQQHQHHVHEGNDVDVGERSAGLAS